ncbi:uncharacterized protein LOC142771530 [Rhipicephalus microplus]|uniref:uncharacterized protein LOC142771530 n=1 Tax=Rhipicephalus microplus TaxID=6941 RepID=UPI003F6B3FDA
MASESISLATFAEEPEKREASSSGSAVHPDQRRTHSCRMPQTLSTRMLPLPGEQGDTAVKEALSGVLAEKLEDALKTLQVADELKERQRRHRSLKNKPDKSRRRQSGAKSSVASGTPNPMTSRSAEVTNAGTEALVSQLQEDEARDALEKAKEASSRRSTRRKKRSVRLKRCRRHQLLTGESPKKLVADHPGDASPLQPLAGSTSPCPTHPVVITGQIWNLDVRKK